METVSGNYVAVDGFGGTRHLGVWPLADAAQSCFGLDEWPPGIKVPQASIEFEVANEVAVGAAAEESHALSGRSNVDYVGGADGVGCAVFGGHE